MELDFQDLTVDNARVIADTWKHPGEYAFYDMDADPEDHEEFVSPELWNGRHLQAVSGLDVIGFLIIEPADEGVVSIGLGVRPDLTGRGRGAAFVMACLDHIRRELPTVRITLSVAAFNRRAIRAYLHSGFVQVGTHMQKTNGTVFNFCDMEFDLETQDRPDC